MQKITPFLWFDNNAEKAVQFYTSIFKNSKDKYGISWQIVPTFVGEMLKAKETDKTHRMLKALWQMEKLDVKRLKSVL